ncbi:hypothetical protein TSUD_375420 [Trifolium subterraneum]|uniref:Reverse transcriptase zinc-binding domain-containing protein n=1 Tax=Trifolium subterraneum TaxID=3900 RepID=A0A2Z6NL79_TRISU|nr:hypothetical protein TSUD_375420 [Trifolium subterraneum]
MMSCFFVAKSICAQIEKAICRFWWGSKDRQCKIHWKTRADLFKAKFEVGLGFRDMHLFNLALLAKQVWRLHSSPNSLLSQCLKARYYPNADILHAHIGVNPSFSWRSIQQASWVIQKGTCWKIGNGHHINIWEDNWLSRQNGFKILTPRDTHHNLTKVSDLITTQPIICWNHNIIDQVFLPFEREHIKQIPLIQEPMDDQLMWPYGKDGTYTVKTGPSCISSLIFRCRL